MKNLIRYQDAVHVLLERVPKFALARATNASYMSHDDDSPYLVFGDFGLFLKEIIKEHPNTESKSEILRESFELLGEMVTPSDAELSNLVVVNVFELLVGSVESKVAREYLSGKALGIFERVVDGWTLTSYNAR